MVQHKPTPEEQLLKLIENPGGASGSKGPEAEKPGKKGASRPPLNFSAMFGKLSGAVQYWRQSLQKKNAAGGGVAVSLETVLDIKWINRALIVTVILVVGYLLIDLTLFKPGRPRFMNQVGVTDAVFPVRGDLGGTQDVSYYLQGLRRRNPFLDAGTATPAPSEEEPASRGNEEVMEKIQGIRLVGISWGDEPLAMVEDSSTGRTYFLKKNQEFHGVKVQEIQKQKIIVTYEGQEAELI